jgi:hypothetical protein
VSSSPDRSEAVKLIADWAKWLITIETAVTVAVGVLFTSGDGISRASKIFGTVAVSSFLVSVVAAAMLLLTLPDIVQHLEPDEDVWLTSDSVAGPLLRLNTQILAATEAVFFGIGLIAVTAMVVTLIWA